MQIRTRILLLLLTFKTAVPFHMDLAHFYHAPLFFGESRFEKEWLGSFDLHVATGSTRNARSKNGKKIPLLNIYQSPPTHTSRFSGKFSITTLTACYIQNCVKGFFVGVTAPYKSVSLTDICSTDCTTETTTTHHFLSYKKRGLSNTTLLTGWAINYEKTEVLDFIDGTITFGFHLPTTAEKNRGHPVVIPIGYEDHTAFSVRADGAVGLYDWLTYGLHLQGTTFLGTQKRQIQVGTFVKADHLIQGWSLLCGYTYTNHADHTCRQKTESVWIARRQHCFTSIFAKRTTGVS